MRCPRAGCGCVKALRAALAAVERLGAFTEVVEQPGGVLVRNYRARSRALCEPSPVFVALLLPFSRRPPASLRSSSACAASASSANTWCSGRPKAHARRGQSLEHRIRFAALHESGYRSRPLYAIPPRWARLALMNCVFRFNGPPKMIEFYRGVMR